MTTSVTVSANRKRIISLDVSQLSYDETTREILDLGSSHTPSYVCYANVHMTIEGHWSPAFAEIVNNANIVAPDGVPLAKAFKSLYGVSQERVAGMDMLPSLIADCEKEGLSIYFFGTTNETLDAMRKRIEKDHPNLRIAGMFSPPFGSLNAANNEKYAQMINDSGANLVMVALGCPKQETWMSQNYKKINAVLLGVGGAFDVYAGVRKRAPSWMQKLALEWLYRLAQEPKRMFKRYFVTNSTYIWLLSKQIMAKK
ncbi:WecB/TagA/CpsF family glycosyltransferase [Cytophagaceae bacterium DM2B3-1]|uniref:WecB/TagA/CpsF family glycosyltransferase n=1 Tax=Xanthocytophaga flava TaxID=3048013 RepID=A0AAE3U563_9BACT|nr:WecB/TagA/CpsF family glycosyltransferase [Xanthocytophaga flavus]MDJ1468362.1 WecB/TagA/CpsF family glycosyltransferase [Xanthocytophaga flavus]MDJ1480434.1 WecB/TagA/CpsF family glycosyltransferase [Xanthocytophaga flavus]MDJ1493248.1 WecB/TagA/CpsF family glycosyltransferase [Xanthocytophaga flavus]